MLNSYKISFGIPKFFGRSISKDLTICLVLIVLVTATLVIAINYYLVTSNAKKNLNQKADEYISYLVGSLELPLWEFDDDSIFKLGRAYSANELVAKLRITGFSGRVVLNINKEEKAGLIMRRKEVIHDDQIIGHIELGLTSRLYEKNNLHLLWTNIFTIIVVVICLSIAAGFLFKVLIKKPLDNLIVGINQIAQGDYDHRASKARQSEIKAILSKFDYMAEQVKRREHSLSEVNRQLKRGIAERKRNEVEMRRMRNMLVNVINSMPSVLVAVDLEGKVTRWNREAENDTGVTADEALGQTLADVFPRLAGEMEEVSQAIKDRETKSKEKKVRMVDGEMRFEDVTIYPLMNDDIEGAVIRVDDITERKQALKERKKLEAQLAQAQRMEAIGTLAGGIAHDFNNILGAIMGYTELAILDIPKTSPASVNLKQVLKASHRAKDVVSQILAFSRQTEQADQPLKIGSIIKEGLKLLRASIPTTIEIRQNIAKESGTVMVDPSQIHQVIMNLCTNAAHAMQETGGVLEVNLDEVNLGQEDGTMITDLSPDSYVRITVSDTGHGIPSELKDRIFDPYFTTKEIGVGTGLGLSVVHGIVKSHGGNVSVYSESGKGTTFHVYLPRVDAEAREVTTVEEAPPTGDEHILFVDDEETLVQIGRQMLERLGYTVTTRTSSIEALEAFRDNPNRFDLVITDQTMPNMTGEILAKEMMQIRPNIPVVLCTGFSHLVDKRKSQQLGIKDFLMKPLIMKDLAETIRKVLGTSGKNGG